MLQEADYDEFWWTIDGQIRLTWDVISLRMALYWSKIRAALGIKPEFPAGLANFMKEMGW